MISVLTPEEYRSKAADKMSEADLQARILEIAKLYGWWAYHTYDSRKSTPGFPDLFMVRPPRVVFSEVKAMSGRLTGPQQMVASMLRRCPSVEFYLWRPIDYLDGSIAKTLSRLG